MCPSICSCVMIYQWAADTKPFELQKWYRTFWNHKTEPVSMVPITLGQTPKKHWKMAKNTENRRKRMKMGKKWRFSEVFAVFRYFSGVWPNIMGTIEAGSSIHFWKGLYHFCSSNGLVSAAVYTNVTHRQTDKKITFFGGCCCFLGVWHQPNGHHWNQLVDMIPKRSVPFL